MKKIALLLLAAALSSSFPQSRSFIYLKDKGIDASTKLSKYSNEFLSVENSLSQKSIARRIKNMGSENYLTYEDIPINPEYIWEFEALGIKIYRKLKWLNAVSCYLSQEKLDLIKHLPFVERVTGVKKLKYKYPDEVTVGDNIPKKTSRNNHSLDYGDSFIQYELSDVPAIHDLGISGEGVIIGLIDAGFDWRNHPATQNLDVIAEYDFVFNDYNVANEPEDPSTQHNHGTATLSVTGGYAPGHLIGPSFSASFVLAKTEYVASETNIEEDNYVAALQWMDSIGVDIVSSSVGYNIFNDGEESYTYEDMNGRTSIVTIASELAFERGMVTITSAGNEGNDPWYYITVPADGKNIIAVGAVNSLNQLASFSSRGPTYDGRLKPEVVADGVFIHIASPGVNPFVFANGTSFSAPIVTGIAGMLLSANPHLSNVQVRNIIIESGDRVENPDNDYGFGLLSAKRAITFPNLSFENNRFKLHKIFTGDQSGSPSINYRINDENFIRAALIKNEGQGYTFTFPSMLQGDSVRFYFSYEASTTGSLREPEVKDYRFTYGDLNITLQRRIVVEPFVPEEYSLLQNFPNPFNSQTKIAFLSKDAVPAEMKIFDLLGRKIRDLFNGIAVTGTNIIYWDGKNNYGGLCTSGIYFYSLSINGKFFTKKLVFLR